VHEGIFILRKINKNYCYQSCSFGFKYAPKSFVRSGFTLDPLRKLTALPRLPNWVRGGVPGNGKKRKELMRGKEKDRERKGTE